MAEQKSKKGFFGKFVNLLSGKPEEADENAENNSESKSIHGPEQNEPADLSFVRKFIASGGKFLYCADEEEAYSYLQMIMQESGLEKVFAQPNNLISILNKAGIAVENQIDQADAFCSYCEYLVSFNGGIMITAKQTMGRKLVELPDTFITIARTSQITENLRSALTGIRIKYKSDIPSQITTIKGPKKVEEIEEEDTTKICNKEIYLLLLEDQA
jgi:L-lactate utilization protein LutB